MRRNDYQMLFFERVDLTGDGLITTHQAGSSNEIERYMSSKRDQTEKFPAIFSKAASILCESRRKVEMTKDEEPSRQIFAR